MVLDHSSVSFNVSKSDVKIGNDMHLVGKIQMSQLVNTNVTIGKQKCHNMQVYQFNLSIINQPMDQQTNALMDRLTAGQTYL